MGVENWRKIRHNQSTKCAIHIEKFQLKDKCYRKAKIKGKVEIFALEKYGFQRITNMLMFHKLLYKELWEMPFHCRLNCSLLEYIVAGHP
ncbi:hypothetical protein ES288_D11G316400v1 [Gossypium darwinii]|uniref:Uncharacterized protein n=1 Tax=Gossypium darwinii TaxID=34276 RepID=A0A5D2ATC1_GOSDA|nr:hypothetical protein ES288_D11G316400v1 [Gossypium darwinii]